MANETPNRVAGGLFVPTEEIPLPFTDRIVNAQGITAFERVDTGQYLLTLQTPLAFASGYAQPALPSNLQAVAGAQITPDGTQVFLSCLTLGTGEPIDPPVIGCTVWSVREGEGEGPSIVVPPVPPPIVPGGGGVTSFNTRTGVVVSAAGDYAASQVTDDSGVGGANVAAALDILAGLIATNAGDIGANTAAIIALAGDVAGLTSDDIGNASLLNGGAGTVSDALNSLQTGWGWFPAETNGSNAGRRIRNIGASGDFDFDFIAPPDLGTLTRLEMWGASRSATNPAAPITLTSSYGTVPEAPDNDTTAVAIAPAFVTGELFSYSIAGAFPSLVPGDSAGVNVNHGGIGGSLDYYGVYMEYLKP